MKILNRIFGAKQDQLVNQCESATPFANIPRCGCDCGQPLNADTKTEEMEGKIFLVGHIPDSWREFHAIKEQERASAALVAQRKVLEASRLAAYRAAEGRLAAIHSNTSVLLSCGVNVKALRSTAEDELTEAERLLSNDQRDSLGLPHHKGSASYVIPVPAPLRTDRPLTGDRW